MEEGDWDACPRADGSMVRVRVTLPEVEVRSQVKRAGGRWDPQRQVYELRSVRFGRPDRERGRYIDIDAQGVYRCIYQGAYRSICLYLYETECC